MCVATMWPARPTSVIGTHRTSKPSSRSSACIRRPTSSTPGVFKVPLLMFTRVSSSVRDRASSRPATVTSFCSWVLSPAAIAGVALANTKAMNAAALNLKPIMKLPRT